LMKYAVVTGSSRGIGAALCKTLAANGYNVAVCYNTGETLAYKLCEELSTKGFSIPVRLDVSDPLSVKNAFSYVFSCFPRIDLLINNAAIDVIKPFEETTLDDWRRILDVDLTGVFLTSKEVVEKMRDGGGTIINVSSVWAKKGAACEIPYSASKAGLEGFTRSLAAEYPELKVYAVSLGYVDTDMNADLTERDIEVFLQENPDVKRKTPEDVAKEIFDTISTAKSGETLILW